MNNWGLLGVKSRLTNNLSYILILGTPWWRDDGKSRIDEQKWQRKHAQKHWGWWWWSHKCLWHLNKSLIYWLASFVYTWEIHEIPNTLSTTFPPTIFTSNFRECCPSGIVHHCWTFCVNNAQNIIQSLVNFVHNSCHLNQHFDLKYIKWLIKAMNAEEIGFSVN